MNNAKEPPTTRFFVLPIISGVLLALSLPPFNLSLFVWFGFVPLLIFAQNKAITIRRVFEGGLITGIIYAIVSVYPLSTVRAWWWFDVSGLVTASKAIFLFWVLFFIVVCASILFGLFAVAFRKFAKNAFIDSLLFAGLWTLFEYGRAILFAGFTWGHIGYALYNETYILQLAYFGGVYALTFFAVFINILIVLLVRSIPAARILFGESFGGSFSIMVCGLVKNRYAYMLVAVFIFVNIYGYSVVHKKILRHERTLAVAIIQTGVETNEITKEGAHHVRDLLERSVAENPEAIVLPENVFPFLFIDERTFLPKRYEFGDIPTGDFYDSLLDLSKKYPDISFVMGLHTVIKKSEYNSMVVLKNGVITDIYKKRFLMPFSEGPLKWLPVGPIGSLKTGDKEDFFIADVKVSPLICSEIIFPELVARRTGVPILSIGNDSVFKSPIVAEENHIMARVRAAEHRVYVVRVMKTGISSIIDRHGRVIAQSQGNGEEILFAQIKY